MGKKGKEIWIGKTCTYHIGEDNIIYITGEGSADEKELPIWEETVAKFEKIFKKKANIFVDLSRAGEQSSEARKLWAEFCDREKAGKIALFGAHPVARVLASFVIGVSKNKNLRFFASREKAIKWLKE